MKKKQDYNLVKKGKILTIWVEIINVQGKRIFYFINTHILISIFLIEKPFLTDF